MDIESLLQELYGLERFGIKLGLGTVRELLRRVGNPQDAFPAIHVTGTNGKGSACAFLDSILRKAGRRVGLYTSPHLVRFNERIRVDGRMIGDEDVARLYAEIKPHTVEMAAESEAKRPTFFEVTTAMAFRWFAERSVEVAVVEVGMGGRMDATNVVRPAAAVLTRIGLEHTENLGRSVERIAREKSGIVKAGVPVVTVEQPALPVIDAAAREAEAPLTVVGRDVRYDAERPGLDGTDVTFRDGGGLRARVPLLGRFQPENAAIAYATAMAVRDRFGLKDDHIRKGIEDTTWPGRLHVYRREPLVLVDGAHNAPAAEALAASITDLLPNRKVILVAGILRDKDLPRMAAALGPLAVRVVATRPDSKRAFPSADVRTAFEGYAPASESPSVHDAVRGVLARAGPDDAVLVTGSIYTAGEALDALGWSP